MLFSKEGETSAKMTPPMTIQKKNNSRDSLLENRSKRDTQRQGNFCNKQGKPGNGMSQERSSGAESHTEYPEVKEKF